MTFARPIMFLFAVMLCMAGVLAPEQARAHDGPHARPVTDMHRDIRKIEMVASYDQGASGLNDRQCAGQACCGPACNAGGCMIAAISKLPEPMEASALIVPLAFVVTKGVGPAGIRRPPRS